MLKPKSVLFKYIEALVRNKIKSKEYCDRINRHSPEMYEDEIILFKRKPKDYWTRELIKSRSKDLRSYVVEYWTGNSLRRNCFLSTPLDSKYHDVNVNKKDVYLSNERRFIIDMDNCLTRYGTCH